MSDDLHYVPGSFYRLDERTGFKVRAEKTRKEWTGRYIRIQSWEERHPQDFVRGVRDDQFVPEPRPRQTDVFIGPYQTTVAQFASAGSVSVNMVQPQRIIVGDIIGIMLDNKEVFRVVVTQQQAFGSGFSSGFAINVGIASPLPYSTSPGNIVTDYSALAKPSIG